ncbi:MAG: hypothetical protein HC767_08140 [Akkermansiaceae bacterium]|nr:hypothetical protein [Akkermansiaceae bacterium]
MKISDNVSVDEDEPAMLIVSGAKDDVGDLLALGGRPLRRTWAMPRQLH